MGCGRPRSERVSNGVAAAPGTVEKRLRKVQRVSMNLARIADRN